MPSLISRISEEALLESKLIQDITRIEFQINKLQESPSKNREILLTTYRRVFERKKKLLDSLGL